MAARAPPTGINGRPVAISPRMSYQANNDRASSGGGGGGVLSFLSCGGADSPFLLCDGSPPNEVDFDMNPTGVYVAVHTKQWELATERVKVYPREASTWVVRYGSPDVDASASAGIVGTNSSSDRVERISAASPRSGSAQLKMNNNGPRVLRWRMLPLHAAILFGAPAEVVKTLIKFYPAGCSARDDQGMLPLHLAFRTGASEEIVLVLLDAYPEAIECADHKGRVPSMLAPNSAMSYGDSIGEAYIKGPAYYYWASRVATADRMRCETGMTKQIRALEEKLRLSNETGRNMLDKTERELTEQVGALSGENVDLKERLVWYESKYDGAEEKEKILVDHTNSLAERLRLTSLSEEHLATKLAKLEARLNNKELELDQARKAAAIEKGGLKSNLAALEKKLSKTEHKAKSLTENLEKKIMETNEVKVRFEKERQLFEKQIDASKECLMELITSSKEDKRMFEEDSKELRRQLQAFQDEVQKASISEKQMFEHDSQELRRQLMDIQNEVRAAASASSNNSAAAVAAAAPASRFRRERPESLHPELGNNARSFISHMSPEQEERLRLIESPSTKNMNRLDSLQKELADVRKSVRNGGGANNHTNITQHQQQAATESIIQSISRSRSDVSYSSRMSTDPAEIPMRKTKRSSKARDPPQLYTNNIVKEEPQVFMNNMIKEEEEEEEEQPFDTYVSTKSISTADQTRDDTECFSHLSDVDTALALGELSKEQQLALEQLDLGGTRDEIAAMLGRVPGLTKNQVTLLVDVASSLVG